MCYYTSWAKKRPGAGRFEPESLDPFLCTHIIYAFAGMKEYRLAAGEPTGKIFFYFITTFVTEKDLVTSQIGLPLYSLYIFV